MEPGYPRTMAAAESLIRVAEVSDPMAARVYAAMLASAGIPATMQGESGGPYAMTVGDWAMTTIWVPESYGDDAVEVLTVGGPDPALTIVAPALRPIGPLPESLRMVAWVVGVILGLSALIGLARILWG